VINNTEIKPIQNFFFFINQLGCWFTISLKTNKLKKTQFFILIRNFIRDFIRYSLFVILFENLSKTLIFIRIRYSATLESRITFIRQNTRHENLIRQNIG
jgi:hypothetical protein